MTAPWLVPHKRVALLSLAFALLVQRHAPALSGQQQTPVLTAAVTPRSAPVNSQVTLTVNLSTPVPGPLVYRFFVDDQPVTVGWQDSPEFGYVPHAAGAHLVRVEAGRRVWSGGDRLSTAIAPLALDSRPTSFHADPQPGPSLRATTSQVATATSAGDTGIWSVPTGEVLRHRRWSVSLYGVNADDGQGFTDITRLPITVAFGLRNRAEIFGSWSLATRIDRDTKPLFFREGVAPASSGAGGGLVVDHPLVRGSWTGNKVGDLLLGAKVNLALLTRGPAAALRAQVKLPVGSESAGTSSGKTDVITDLVVSGRTRVMELAGYGGLMVRGNPSGYSLTNGLRWGVGTTFPLEGRLRASAELYGEKYFSNSITAPAGQIGHDQSAVPTTTHIKSPVILQFGLTWLMANGYFLGAAASWNMAMSSRNVLGVPLGSERLSGSDGDSFGGSLRIGYHFGSSRTRTVEPPPPPPLPPPSVLRPVPPPVLPRDLPLAPPRDLPRVLPPATSPGLPPDLPPVPSPVRPPVLTLTLTSSTVVAGKPASFAVVVTGASTLPPYVLDTGDGTAPQALRVPTFTHTYPRAGVFLAAVRLAAGGSGTGSSVAVTVVPAPLVARPRPSAPRIVVPRPTLVLRLTSPTVVAGEPASFAVSVDGAAALPPFVLDAGDGSASEPLRTATFTHAYPRAGVFRAAVGLPAGVPGTGSSVAVTVVAPPPPTLTLTLTSSTVVAGEPASFAVFVQGAAALPPYVLDTGDGSAPQSLRAATFTHVYPRAGVFTAVVSPAEGVAGIGSSLAVAIAPGANWTWSEARWTWPLVIALVALAGLLIGRRAVRRTVAPTLHAKPDREPQFDLSRPPGIGLEVHSVQNLASLQFKPPTPADREP